MTPPHLIPTYLFVFTISVVMVLTSPVEAEQLSRTITVQGTGISGAVPDTAEVSAGALTRAATATKTLSDNNAAVAQILALAANFDIAERDMRTNGFSLTPIFERQQRRNNEPQTPTIIGYQSSNNVSIKLRNIKNLGKFLDRLDSVGANQIRGISFDLSDRKVLLNRARRIAVSDARAKAALYAVEAGVVLGSVLEIVESGISQPRRFRGEAAMLKASADVPIAAGTLQIRANVTMRFAIVDN